MTLRSTLDTLESLRALLRELEQCQTTPQDAATLADLKQILRHRITELEVIAGIEANPVEMVTASSRAESDRSH
jgi:hypothetical protein